MLAILLLHAGEIVSIDRLVDGVWGASPPEDAATALHQHVSRLRKLLEPHTVIETRSPGYVVPIDAASLDLRQFETLSARGRDLLEAGSAEDASAAFAEALGLWRGRPFADLDDEPFVRDATMPARRGLARRDGAEDRGRPRARPSSPSSSASCARSSVSIHSASGCGRS